MKQNNETSFFINNENIVGRLDNKICDPQLARPSHEVTVSIAANNTIDNHSDLPGVRKYFTGATNLILNINEKKDISYNNVIEYTTSDVIINNNTYTNNNMKPTNNTQVDVTRNSNNKKRKRTHKKTKVRIYSTDITFIELTTGAISWLFDNKFVFFIPGLTMKYAEIRDIVFVEFSISEHYKNCINHTLKTLLSTKLGISKNRIKANINLLIQVKIFIL